MFIVPISGVISPVESYFDNESAVKARDEDQPKFSDVFKEMFDNAVETQRVSDDDAVRLAMGEIDDLHTVYNNMQKAAIAVEALTSVKNTAVDSYRQIMQMNI